MTKIHFTIEVEEGVVTGVETTSNSLDKDNSAQGEKGLRRCRVLPPEIQSANELMQALNEKYKKLARKYITESSLSGCPHKMPDDAQFVSELCQLFSDYRSYAQALEDKSNNKVNKAGFQISVSEVEIYSISELQTKLKEFENLPNNETIQFHAAIVKTII